MNQFRVSWRCWISARLTSSHCANERIGNYNFVITSYRNSATEQECIEIRYSKTAAYIEHGNFINTEWSYCLLKFDIIQDETKSIHVLHLKPNELTEMKTPSYRSGTDQLFIVIDTELRLRITWSATFYSISSRASLIWTLINLLLPEWFSRPRTAATHPTTVITDTVRLWLNGHATSMWSRILGPVNSGKTDALS